MYSDIGCHHIIANSFQSQGIADLHSLSGNKDLDTSARIGQFAIKPYGVPTAGATVYLTSMASIVFVAARPVTPSTVVARFDSDGKPTSK